MLSQQGLHEGSRVVRLAASGCIEDKTNIACFAVFGRRKKLPAFGRRRSFQKEPIANFKLSHEVTMYIAMNRFRVALGREEEFIEVWKNRDSTLDSVPGFQQFHLLQGKSDEEHTPFVSHSVWESRETFTAWTESDSFRKAHADAKMSMGVCLGPPQFEGFDCVL